ncbi:MAG TPA: ATP-binding cassette domain-containing protein [Acidimicrobiia bacterium]|nr:ATP-binding cassette domain-containing protein [Acidimicrobiia bacterium]
MHEKLDLRYPADGSVVSVEGLEVRQGDRLVVFGPNGSGKSTLLRLMAGTLPGGPALDSTYLPQHPYLFRGSAGFNMGLGLTAEEAVRARHLADRIGVGDLLGFEASSLSGGEAQRLTIARVLARRRPWVLLDEPLSAQDERDRFEVAALIIGEIGDRGAVIITHDRQEAAFLGNRMAVLVGGRVLQEGPVGEVFSLPAGDEVAAAVGIGNVIDGEAVDTDGPLASLRAGEMTIWGVGDVEPGRTARAVFGAEAVTLFRGRDGAAGSARNRWIGTVTEFRDLGRLVEVVIDAGSRVVALVTPGSQEVLQLGPGADVTLTVKATAVRVNLR